MPHNHPPDVRAPRRQLVQYLAWRVRMPPRMYQYRRARLSLRHSRRPQRLALIRRQRPCAAHLPDYPRLDAAAVHPLRDVPHNHPRQVVHVPLIHIRRMHCVHIIARAHNHMRARVLRYARQRARIAPDADSRGIHNRPAARRPVARRLRYRRVHIHQLQVRAIAIMVMPYPPHILQRQRRVSHPRRRAIRMPEHKRKVYVQMLMRSRNAQFPRLNRPQNRLNQPLHAIRHRNRSFRRGLRGDYADIPAGFRSRRHYSTPGATWTSTKARASTGQLRQRGATHKPGAPANRPYSIRRNAG